MRILTFLTGLCAAVLACSIAYAGQSLNSTSGAESATPGRLGKVNFPASCTTAVQNNFDTSVALLHSFQYDQSTSAFRQIAQRDPHCAMADWGLAMSLYQQLWDFPNAATLKKGREYVEKAGKIGAKTNREREYVAAAAAFYQADPKLSHLARAQAYSKAMAKVARDNPGDVDGAAFYALSLVALAQDGGGDLANRKQAITILEPLFTHHPDNPGVDHYLIHAADTPGLARFGLAAARNYARIAPDSAHALHMPSHIFTRLGHWQESIRSNIASAAAAEQATRSGRDNEWGHQIHALTFLEYAYLQMGRRADARRVIEDVRNVPGDNARDLAENQALFRATYDIENHEWKAAAALALPAGYRHPRDRAEIYWARTLGAARAGDARGARQDFNALNAAFNDVQADMKKEGYPPEPGDNVMLLEAEAWLDYAEGQHSDAVKTLRAAADKEDAAGVDILAMPAREMLGDMLFQLRQSAQALAAYELALKEAPNRFDALDGAARAADLAGYPSKTRSYYLRLVKSCGPQADREEYREARIMLAKG